MPHSKPLVPPELQILLYLDARMDLLPRDKKNLNNLRKGYEGELNFFHLLEKKLTSKCIRLYDLLLESNQTEFQIDNLLIYQNTIYMNEVKYYGGDFLVRDDKWYVVASEREIRNPILQRSEFLLRHLLQQMGVHLKIETRLIFVHPEFTLYQAPYDQPLIFPTQLNRCMQKLNSTPSRLTSMHHNLAEQLIHRHITTSRHERLPEYDFDGLEKGIVCELCGGFMNSFTIYKLHCENCEHEESMGLGIMRSITEFHTLFPNRRITTSIIYDWCGNIYSKKSIRKILTKNMELVRNGRFSYYVLNKKSRMTFKS